MSTPPYDIARPAGPHPPSSGALVIVVAGAIIEGRRVLVTKRKAGAHLGGLWELPGGKIAPGEDPRTALARELREEIGVDAEIGAPIEVTFHAYPEKIVLLLFFEATRRPGSPEPAPLDVADLTWADAATLGSLEFPAADVRVVEILRERLLASKSVAKKSWTPDEYLALERASEQKHELYRGEIFAMAGASRAHNVIVANISAELRDALRHRPCDVYPSDMRVKVAATGLYAYPDVSIVCGPARFDDERADTLLNPGVIFEVLSDSTESYDHGKKFELYRSMASLTEYVLVSQREPLVEHFVRRADGAWVMRDRRAGERVELASLECSVAVDEMYLKVFVEDGAAG